MSWTTVSKTVSNCFFLNTKKTFWCVKYRNLRCLIGTKHLHKSKHFHKSQNTSTNHKTLPQITKHFHKSQNTSTNRNTSTNHKTLPQITKHFHKSKHFNKSQNISTNKYRFVICGSVLPEGYSLEFLVGVCASKIHTRFQTSPCTWLSIAYASVLNGSQRNKDE